MIIGIDFDNTVASYDDLMYRWAIENGLIESGGPGTKKAIRDAIRGLPNGELKWRGLQAHAYGAGMQYACPMKGVKRFLARCKGFNIPVWIVSHKTKYANFGDANVDLRAAAMEWMDREGLLDVTRFGIGRDRIYFEDSRELKIARIKALGVTHFIDDLEETFTERSFPGEVEKILLANECSSGAHGCVVCATWSEIERCLLHARGFAT